jgi:hypothetical protein
MPPGIVPGFLLQPGGLPGSFKFLTGLIPRWQQGYPAQKHQKANLSLRWNALPLALQPHARNNSTDIAEAVASITESDPGAQSEKGSYRTPG